MARRRKSSGRKLEKAQRSFYILLNTGTQGYLDLAECLSKVNRKLFRQGYVYGVESIEFNFDTVNPATVDHITMSAFCAPDYWGTHNAYVKSKALWNEMQSLVLEDNPSIRGKWHDYKVYLDQAQHAGANIQALDAASVAYQGGKWDYSTFVLPQHDVNPATGVPLIADECTAHIVGPNVGAPGAFTSVGLISNYALSRATVHAESPNVPAGFGDSFFNLLTDSGSQEPELADVIEDENDEPPYHDDNYPGGASNAPWPVSVDFNTVSSATPNGALGPFVAPCGLLLLKADSFKNGDTGPAVPIIMRVTLMPGNYKGVAAIPMGQ